jgi:hypothetical protein
MPIGVRRRRIISALAVFDCTPRAAKDGGRGHNPLRGMTASMKATIRRYATPCAAAIAAAALALPLDSAATTNSLSKPTATTGNVSHVRGTTAVFEGTVQPHGLTTTYYFQFGTTVAYGSQTASATLTAGFTRIKVGVTVVGLRLGEHYRVVATNADGTTFGRDRTYALKSGALKFVIPKEKNGTPTTYGETYVLRGSLTGVGNTLHRLVLQASRYPYLEPFTTITAPVLPSATGSFVLKVPHMTISTQFRVASVDPRPLLSPVVSVHVAVRVTLKVRSSARKGFVRLYGTISPAQVGAHVAFQLLKAVRPGRSEKETQFSTQFSTTSKRGTHSQSRFSFITSIRRRGYYRAYVEIRKAALVSGGSNTVHLSAAPGKTKRKRG